MPPVNFSSPGKNYRGWASRLSVTMRQAHIGGDKLFVDYAGDTVPVIVDRLTGQVRPAQIFVAVMGASNFTYAEASWTQALADWIGAHTQVFAALGGVPKLLVPDNTRVAVIKAGRRHQSLSHTVRVGETKKRSLGSGRRLMTATVFLLYQKGWDSPDALRLQHLPTPIPDSPLTTRAAMMDVCSGW